MNDQMSTTLPVKVNVQTGTSSNSVSVFQVSVTLAEYKMLQRIRQCAPNVIQIDTRTGAVVVLGKSENAANGAQTVTLPPEG